MLFVVLCPGTPEGSTGSGSDFKASQTTKSLIKIFGGRTSEPPFLIRKYVIYFLIQHCYTQAFS